MMQFDNHVEEIPGWLSKNEGQLLQKMASGLPFRAIIVEIGSFQGKSTIYLANGLKSGKIYAIDPHLGETQFGKKKLPPTYQAFLKNTKSYKNIVPIRKTSKEANKNWKLAIDLLHVDGLHEYQFVKQDLKMWLPFLKPNGIVVCHDAFAPYPEVWQAVKEEIFAKSGWAYIGVSDSQVFAIKGKKRLNWQRPFIIWTSNIWHAKNLPYGFRDFIVKRILKLFYLNQFVFRAMLKLDL